MATRVVTVFKGSSMYYSLEELINQRIKFIEEDGGKYKDLKPINENKAMIIYEI